MQAKSHFILTLLAISVFTQAQELDLGFSVDAFLRTYQEQEIDELFRTMTLTGSGEATYFFGNSLFAGVEGSHTQFDGRGIDFTSPEK